MPTGLIVNVVVVAPEMLPPLVKFVEFFGSMGVAPERRQKYLEEEKHHHGEEEEEPKPKLKNPVNQITKSF